MRINYDDAQQIAQVCNLSLRVANRIVQYRKTHGYFRSLEDLKRVKGVGRRLVRIRSLPIDWSAPVSPPEGTQHGGPFSLFMTVFSIVVTTVIAANVRTGSWPYFKENLLSPLPIVRVFGAALFICSSLQALATVVGFWLATIAEFQVNAKRQLRIKRLVLWSLCALVSSFLLVGVCQWVLYWHQPGGYFHQLRSKPAHIVGLYSFGAIVVWVGPIFYCRFFPAKSLSKWFVKNYDYQIAVWSILGAGLAVWLQREMTLFWRIQTIVSGSIYLIVAVLSMAQKSSMYELIAYTFGNVDLRRQDHGRLSPWIAWLNSRLPDPADQRVLAQALSEIYPPSRMRRSLKFIVAAAGAWLILATLSGVMDWLVAHVLDKLK